MHKGTTSEDLKTLGHLPGGGTRPSRALEAFPNHHPERDYTVDLETSEFTCLCPATGQPDFATIRIRYIPGPSVVESKSLKLYLWSFREEGIFHEHLANVILDDLVVAIQPRWCRVEAAFHPRGGIGIVVRAEHSAEGYTPPAHLR